MWKRLFSSDLLKQSFLFNKQIKIVNHLIHKIQFEADSVSVVKDFGTYMVENSSEDWLWTLCVEEKKNVSETIALKFEWISFLRMDSRILSLFILNCVWYIKLLHHVKTLCVCRNIDGLHHNRLLQKFN